MIKLPNYKEAKERTAKIAILESENARLKAENAGLKAQRDELDDCIKTEPKWIRSVILKTKNARLKALFMETLKAKEEQS